MNRNKKILLGLIATLALALAYRLTNPFEQGTTDRLTFARATKVTSPKTADEAPAQMQIRLDLLRSPPQESVTVHRDLFRPPAVPKAAKLEGPKASAPEPAPQSAREKIQEEFMRFKRFGSYQHGKQIYLFLERGKQVLIVTRGDRIDGKYEITDVTEKSVTIASRELSEPLEIHFDEL
jgi:hypothetical protein